MTWTCLYGDNLGCVEPFRLYTVEHMWLNILPIFVEQFGNRRDIEVEAAAVEDMNLNGVVTPFVDDPVHEMLIAFTFWCDGVLSVM